MPMPPILMASPLLITKLRNPLMLKTAQDIHGSPGPMLARGWTLAPNGSSPSTLSAPHRFRPCS